MQQRPGEAASPAVGGGVVCEFVRQRCTHDALFQPFYKRSNRTKGSKILRCFPHCCPNHAHRGFCGSSLHVRVEWPSAAAALRSAPPAIHVLGRFRLSDTPPLPLGHVLPSSTVFNAVQSDDTPNGEWIDSQMIYSWSETNWLFEINSTARWFYGWESSTVKSQRLKDHVLDVYVFAAAADDTLRVVASTTSPSFQLISFRRATDDAMLALSATHHVRQQLQSGAAIGGGGPSGPTGPGGGGGPPPPPTASDPLHHAHRLLQLQHPPLHAQHGQHETMRGPRPPLVHYHADVTLASGPPPPMRPLHHLHATSAPPSATPSTRPLSLPSLRPPMVSAAPSTSIAPQWTAPPLAAAVATSRPLTSLAPLHHALPPSQRGLPPLATQSHSRPLRPAAFAPPTHAPQLPDVRPQPAWRPPQLALARATAPASTGPGVSSTTATTTTSSSSAAAAVVRGRDTAAWEIANLFALLRQIPLADAFERVAWVHETFAQYAAEYAATTTTTTTSPSERTPVRGVDADAEMSVRRALASLGLHASSARKLPSRLLTTLTELAIWLLFDPVTIRQLQGAARSAMAALADPATVRRFYSRAIFFLHDHVGRFLERRFQTTIRDVLHECETVGLQVQHETDSPAVVSSPNAAVGGDRAMKGQDAFVAQVREELVEVTKTETRLKRRRLGTPMRPAVSASLQTQLNGKQWTCSLNDVLVHRVARSSPTSPPSSTPPSDVSLLTLLWFYRQFSVLSLSLHADARLDVRSLFALSSPLCSQLVLDGADRFVGAFPAGEATLATGVGRYAFGDYVGELGGDAQLRVQLFAFLSPTQLEHAAATALPLEHVASDACVCYDIRLRVSASATQPTLVGDVAVRVGALDVDALRRAGHDDARELLREMATWTLREKLAAVRRLDETARVELLYHATGWLH